jgi:hypothetical protein
MCHSKRRERRGELSLYETCRDSYAHWQVRLIGTGKTHRHREDSYAQGRLIRLIGSKAKERLIRLIGSEAKGRLREDS